MWCGSWESQLRAGSRFGISQDFSQKNNFDNSDIFTILTVFDSLFDKFGKFWYLWKILTIFDKFYNPDNFATILDNFDNDNYNPRDLWPLRNWLQFWQLRTWIQGNFCDLIIQSDTGQHSQFLRCLKDKSWMKCFRF